MPTWLNFTLLFIVILVQLIGFFGLLLVFFPGLTVIWIGQLAWAISTGFNHEHEVWQFVLTIAIFMINTILMIGGSLVDNVFMAGSAAKQGAKWWVILISWVVMVVVSIFLTPVVGLLAAMVSLFVIEWIRIKDYKRAFKSSGSMVIGVGSAALVRLVIAVVMIGLWVFWVVVL
jgi:uncharacterized protein YqgC (DUF456 family)